MRLGAISYGEDTRKKGNLIKLTHTDDIILIKFTNAADIRVTILYIFYERVAKPITEKIGEQIKTIGEQTGLLKGLPEALVEINKPMIEYEKEGERLRGIEKDETHYVNLDRGTCINYDAIEDCPKVSVLHLLGKPEQWREARLAAGREIKRLAPRAKNIEQKSNAREPITKEEDGVFNWRHALGPYITNIKALEANQAVIGEGNKGTGFQTSRHPYKILKDRKYGKLTIDVTQLLAKEAGMLLFDEKVDYDFIDLYSKRYDTKKEIL